MDTQDKPPPVTKALLDAVERSFPDKYHEIIQGHLKGSNSLEQVFVEAGRQEVIRSLKVWYDTLLENSRRS